MMNNPKKWADKNCKVCGGEGEWHEFDDTYTCQCALQNRAEYQGEMQFENNYQEA